MFQYTILAVSSQLDFLIESFADYWNEEGLQGSTVMQLQIILEEVASNTINYGYPDGRCNGQIMVKAEVAENNIELIICDDGMAFNPTEFALPDRESSVEDRKVGGLGLHLISELADSVFYQRIGNQNVLRICKKLVQTE